MSQNTTGKVFIVGAGPGAKDLITLKGLRALRQADVILYDALVNPELLDEAPAEAEKIFVGKRCGRHAMEQREINREIVAQALRGKCVVRLKGGDPLLFGRGGEEALACEDSGIGFEIIPGVSSALGAAAYAGIPLTHRGVAGSVAFVTASLMETSTSRADFNDPAATKLKDLAKTVDTLVILMGGRKLRAVAEGLVDAGLSPLTSVAVISQASMETQRTVLGTLENISERVEQKQLASPTLIIVGAVTQFSAALSWFEKKLTAETQRSPGSAEEEHVGQHTTQAQNRSR
ncbi:MAG: uroporphyrinogen-III C-methyltransferase [Acidobacteriia bacterium]|nr:uroporphyrinogen-III C-methyltransferase [Terriglobia bacterium]